MNLYLIGGPMGVGKTTVCRILQQKLDGAVFLDGDWCWDANPFVVNEETKAMVLDNICYLLNRFLSCTVYRNVIFCWVLHQQDILDRLLTRLNTAGCNTVSVSLICREDVLCQRLQQDIRAGLRTPDVLARSLARLPLYDTLDTVKLDVSELTPEQAAEHILAAAGQN